ncbi:hypothetical protein BT96DRAFT_960232 [Gymnopus androsaceus JB14]|uniref:Uncharacterized protein n=1 Tax=Gymnopus androsaceus JB14 TaxID=1447944 RepID=A0A6A4GSJ0_9AGAR|nr:hypothetical protein BT96DRAFT_960232 [Gymnopus androsaceus JB14]
MLGLICSCCQLRGKNQIYNTDHSLCVPRDVEELRHWSRAYKEAQTLSERKDIFENHGVRWSSLRLLDYWDPTRMLVVDAMHCILKGVVHYHCQHVLRLNASAPKHCADGLMYAFDWPWIGYEPEAVPELPRLKEKHVPDVSKVQETLCLALEGEDSMTLNQVWTRLDNQATKGTLQFVVHTLELSLQLNTVGVKSRSKAKKVTSTVMKNHFIALLLNWRLQQPLSSVAHILRTGTPEMLSYIQEVIRETQKPSWLDVVPKNYGEAKAGSIKAGEWRTLSSLYFPVALIIRWGDNNGCAPPNNESESGLLLKALDHTMALFQPFGTMLIFGSSICGLCSRILEKVLHVPTFMQ